MPLESIWGRSAESFVDRLWSAPAPAAMFDVLESGLLAQARGWLGQHPVVERAVRALCTLPPALFVARLAAEAALSSRRFIEIFRRDVEAAAQALRAYP